MSKIGWLLTLNLPEADKRALLDLIQRYGRRHPTGSYTMPEGCLDAEVEFTSRTYGGHLREAVVNAVRLPTAAK
jgi:hypothetical protein